MAVSKRVRFEVFRRDGHKCKYCGASAEDGPLSIDHVTPVALGGSDDPSNLVTACRPCNSGKTSTSPEGHIVAQVADDAVRWAAAMKAAAAEIEADRVVRGKAVDRFDEAWSGWTDGRDQKVYRPDDWRAGLVSMLAAGLPIGHAIDLIRVAMKSKAVPDQTWRYFCGCAWRSIKDIQARASETVRAPGPVGGIVGGCGHCHECTYVPEEEDEAEEERECVLRWPTGAWSPSECEHCGRSEGQCLWALGHQAGRCAGFEIGVERGRTMGRTDADEFHAPDAWAGAALRQVIDRGGITGGSLQIPGLEESRAELEQQIAEIGIGALVAAAAESPF